jgi:hypothetical protein
MTHLISTGILQGFSLQPQIRVYNWRLVVEVVVVEVVVVEVVVVEVAVLPELASMAFTRDHHLMTVAQA